MNEPEWRLGTGPAPAGRSQRHSGLPKGWLRGLLIAVVSLASAGSGAAGGAEAAPTVRPVLLELFTSQSCSSCPPADALLRELAQRRDVLALSFHVDYWNDLGWVDPLSAAAFTARQRSYARLHGFEVYTPQLVVDGQADAVGSDRDRVENAIAAAQSNRGGTAATIERAAGQVRFSIAPGSGVVNPAGIYLLSYNRKVSTSIGGGENGGRRLDYTNVVRSIRDIGSWHGEALTRSEPLLPQETGDSLALIVQDREARIWAVASQETAASTVAPPVD